MPWIIATNDGKILMPHCNCMAVLGESCTHVASMPWVSNTQWGTEKRKDEDYTKRISRRGDIKMNMTTHDREHDKTWSRT